MILLALISVIVPPAIAFAVLDCHQGSAAVRTAKPATLVEPVTEDDTGRDLYREGIVSSRPTKRKSSKR